MLFFGVKVVRRFYDLLVFLGSEIYNWERFRYWMVFIEDQSFPICTNHLEGVKYKWL